MFRTLEISASGLMAQRTRVDVISGNIAHAQTTLNEDGKPEPFQRRIVALATQPKGDETGGQGVRAEIELDTETPFRKVYSPEHPHADKDGNVSYPNVNLITEFVNALEASRAYEANLSAIDVTKDMAENTFRILA
ncbi:MAG: flagellar basal body rod protein FlgC [Planctomycetaceae bacterium]